MSRRENRGKQQSQARFRFISVVALGFLLILSGSVFSQELSTLGDVKPFSLDGSLSLAVTKYSVSGAERRRPATSWNFVGSPTLSLYGVSFPFTFVLSDQENEFRQPFNQYGVSPAYKWATIHLGYRSLTYSKYTLSGITFLGGGLDLQPGPLRLSVMYGRFQRAVEEDTVDLGILPAYERKGYAAKIGFASEKNFFNAIYLHSIDDSNSLKRAPSLLPLFPSENVVIGLNTKVFIVEELSLDAEGAASLYTRDIRSPKIDSSKIPNSLSGLIETRSSTSLTFASNVGLAFTIPHFSIRIGYERIEPDYNSHGAYYFTTDIENYTISPSFDIDNGKVRFSGSVGLQNDNLLATKISKTDRVIGSGNLSLNPSQTFGIDLNYTNYSTTQTVSNTNALSKNDSIRVRNVSQSASFTPRLLFISPTMSHSIVFSGSYQEFKDLNVYSTQLSNSQTKTASLNYNVSFFQSGLNLGGSLLFADSRQSTATTQLFGINVNASKGFFDNTLSLGGSFGMSFNTVEPLSSKSTTFNESLNSSYRFTEQGTFSLTIYATQNSSGLPGLMTTTPFNEITATLSYSHNFSF